MANMIELQLITPERMKFSGPAKEFTAPAYKGEVNVLPEHTLYMTRLVPGQVTIVAADGTKKQFAVYEGYLEIDDDKAVILVEEAISPDDINLAEVEEKLKNIRQKLDGMVPEDVEYEKTELELQRLMALLFAKKPVA